MAVETVATCDCCGATLPSSATPDVLITIGRKIDGDDVVVAQQHYGYICGCAQRVSHVIDLELTHHDKRHSPPTE